jgi:EAL domain-containing protein (putative c-di-GMP-specific phosphodiesterase class I)
VNLSQSRQVIAEGVEAAAERDFFLNDGATLVHGYLFAKAVFRAITSAATMSWPAQLDR